MLRLGKNLGWVVLAAAGLMLPTAQAKAQTSTPQVPPPMTSPYGSSSAKAPSPSPQAPLAPRLSPTASAPSPSPHMRNKKAPVAEAVPSPAPPPATLEQSPPTAPQVSFQNGELTIDATNSTLSQVLRAVQSRTGAAIDIPGGAGNERVAGRLGPGQPRDVLNALLNGSKFDYVILGVTGNPGAVQKVILTPRQGGATTTAQSNNPPQQMPDDESPGDEATPVADAAENEYQNPDQPPPPPGGFRHPMMPPGGQVDPGAAFGNGQTQNGPKTPEQLMQQMQQQQQQQQQYQQQLNPANQNPQPQ